VARHTAGGSTHPFELIRQELLDLIPDVAEALVTARADEVEIEGGADRQALSNELIKISREPCPALAAVVRIRISGEVIFADVLAVFPFKKSGNLPGSLGMMGAKNEQNKKY
jgi:hypothetical protein